MLDLIATLVTLTVVPGNLESELESAGGGAALLASFSPGGSSGAGQSLGVPGGRDDGGLGEADVKSQVGTTDAGEGGQGGGVVVERLAPWARFAVGLDEAWQELRARMVGAERAVSAPTANEEGARLARQRGHAGSFPSDSRGGFVGGRHEIPLWFARGGWDSCSIREWRTRRCGDEWSLEERARGRRELGVSTRFSSGPRGDRSVLEELAEAALRASRLFRVVLPVNGKGRESPANSMTEIVAASMALSMTWERSNLVGRRRRKAYLNAFDRNTRS